MQQLRNLIRKLIIETVLNPKLQQGLNTLQQNDIFIQDDSVSEFIELYLAKEKSKNPIGRFVAELDYYGDAWGENEDYSGPELCMIVDTHLDKEWKGTGLGPLFYEYIADRVYPAWIINDRGSTSIEAQKMYRYYSRNKDVYDSIQLDALVDDGYVLTGTTEDDIRMESWFDIEYPGQEWESYQELSSTKEFKNKLLSSPFSKAYRRREKSGIKELVDNYIDPDFNYRDYYKNN